MMKKKDIKLVFFALLSTIMLVFNLWAYAVCEDVQSMIPSTTDIPSIVELPVEVIPAETQSVGEQPAEEEPSSEKKQSTKEPYVTEPPVTKEPATEQVVEKVSVTVDALSTSSVRSNLYAQENINSSILYVFAATDTVVVLDQGDGWLYVDFNGLQGYIALFEPVIENESAAIEAPAAEEAFDTDEATQWQETPPAQEAESSVEPDVEESASTDQELSATEAPAEPRAGIKPVIDEDGSMEQEPAGKDNPMTLDLTVEPDAEPHNISIIIYSDTQSVLHYGDVITLTGTLDGEEGLDYTLQWQQRDQGGTWYDLEGENHLQYSFALTKENEYSEWKLDIRMK